MRRNLTNRIREWLRTFGRPFDSYRPELHYMRGPGPKCRAKRTATAGSAASAAVETAPAFPKIAKAHP